MQKKDDGNHNDDSYGSNDMDDENGALIPHLKAPPETFSTRDGKSINNLDKKNKDKNQRKR